MNDLVCFDYDGKNIRTIERDGQLWWVLADICRVLEISNTRITAERLDDDERRKLNLHRQGETWCINESGLYSVILRSDKPQAKPFRRWVTHEVLPSIRNFGSYSPETALILKCEKTWCGERVLTTSDIGQIMGVSRSRARTYIMRHFKDGLDYFVLKGNSLKLYRHENPEEITCGKTIMLIQASKFYSTLNAKY